MAADLNKLKEKFCAWQQVSPFKALSFTTNSPLEHARYNSGKQSAEIPS